jgi:hypothetical protein
MNKDNHSPQDESAPIVDVDITELFSLFWKFKFLLAAGLIFFAGISVAYSLSIPNIYTSSALMKTTDSASDSSSGSSGLGGLANNLGLNLSPSAPTGNKSDLAVAKILSRDFLDHLLNMPGVAANISAVKSYDPDSKKVSYDESRYLEDKQIWITKQPTHIELHKEYVDMLDLSFDKKTGFLTIKLEHKSPYVAHELLSLIIKEVNILSRDADKNRSRASLSYLTSQLDKIQQKDIKLSINQLIGVEMRKLTLVNIEENYLIEPIDRPHIPHKKSFPARARISIIGTLSGFALTMLGLIIWYFLYGRERDYK